MRTYKARLRDSDDSDNATPTTSSTESTYHDVNSSASLASSSGSGLKRSYSSPNIAKMMADEEERKSSSPTVDRSAKPKPVR